MAAWWRTRVPGGGGRSAHWWCACRPSARPSPSRVSRSSSSPAWRRAAVTRGGSPAPVRRSSPARRCRRACPGIAPAANGCRSPGGWSPVPAVLSRVAGGPAVRGVGSALMAGVAPDTGYGYAAGPCGVPEGGARRVAGSVAAHDAIADKMADTGESFRHAAYGAFTDGISSFSVVCGIVAFRGAAAVAVLLTGKTARRTPSPPRRRRTSRSDQPAKLIRSGRLRPSRVTYSEGPRYVVRSGLA